ncbi:transcriptional regulator [Brevibacterium casei]|uniref:Transcriptional regulator n=1 Tax=Brevibacterium casei TaxID=33889 RepID=A0A269ZCS6_9MICO|nr:helix-turn-helix transcriptional regulator [Brevibacterium casei]PAK95401.1 transcriptional regulator [Brevibacterium casei]
MPADLGEERVVCHLDALLTQREMTLTELSNAVGVSLANLSVLKNNRAKAIRYSTLVALCAALDCQPGDLFTVTTAED